MENVHDHKLTITQAKKYCKDSVELIENYDIMCQDTTQVWVCHHRREIDEHKSMQQLIDEELYYDRPACELIFLTKSEHSTLHAVNKSEETRDKLSEAIKAAWSRQDIKEKMSQAQKGNKNGVGKRSEAARNNMKEALNRPDIKEKHREATKAALNRPDVKEKMSQVRKGMKWWNNGLKNVRARECPEGFTPGRMK